jgi:regulator of sigma E protease
LGTTAQIYYDTPSQRIFAGFLHAYNILSYSVATMGNLVDLSIEEKTVEPLADSVSGPVGIYSIVNNIVSYSGKEAFLNLIDLMALISVSLAFLNVLPLPALDGGRILFIFIELIRGKKVNPQIEATVHKFGMLALLSLLVLITIRDVSRLFL